MVLNKEQEIRVLTNTLGLLAEGEFKMSGKGAQVIMECIGYLQSKIQGLQKEEQHNGKKKQKRRSEGKSGTDAKPEPGTDASNGEAQDLLNSEDSGGT